MWVSVVVVGTQQLGAIRLVTTYSEQWLIVTCILYIGICFTNIVLFVSGMTPTELLPLLREYLLVICSALLYSVVPYSAWVTSRKNNKLAQSYKR